MVWMLISSIVEQLRAIEPKDQHKSRPHETEKECAAKRPVFDLVGRVCLSIYPNLK